MGAGAPPCAGALGERFSSVLLRAETELKNLVITEHLANGGRTR